MPDNSPLDALTDLIGPSADPVAAGWRLREIAAQVEPAALLAELVERRESLADSDPAILGALLRIVHTQHLREGAPTLPECDPEKLNAVAASVADGTPNRYLLLHLLALMRTHAALTTLVTALQQRPPTSWVEAAQVLSPLLQHQDWPIDAVFPALLDCIQHPSLAASVLDLANGLTRNRRVAAHPATEQLPRLNHLLGEVTHRLHRFEEDPRSFGDNVESVQATLGEAVSLAVSLCDAVGLIGDPSSIAKLYPAVELRHRRVQCEAAGALAAMGDELGQKRLLELASEPSARLRAVHYADELGFGELVDEQFRTDEAVAEAEISIWLSQPQQMGVPPTNVEVVDQRRMLWPSFPEPIDVFLVRFEYSFAERQYSNVGVVGPVTFAFSADVAELPVEDIYAIYAGWHAEHPEIFTVPAEQFNEAQQRVVQPLAKHLDLEGYESIKPELLGFFLDEQAAVFAAVRDATACLVVTDGLETIDQPIAGRSRPLSAANVFDLYKGRKMLRTFNP